MVNFERSCQFEMASKTPDIPQWPLYDAEPFRALFEETT